MKIFIHQNNWKEGERYLRLSDLKTYMSGHTVWKPIAWCQECISKICHQKQMSFNSFKFSVLLWFFVISSDSCWRVQQKKRRWNFWEKRHLALLLLRGNGVGIPLQVDKIKPGEPGEVESKSNPTESRVFPFYWHHNWHLTCPWWKGHVDIPKFDTDLQAGNNHKNKMYITEHGWKPWCNGYVYWKNCKQLLMAHPLQGNFAGFRDFQAALAACKWPASKTDFDCLREATPWLWRSSNWMLMNLHLSTINEQSASGKNSLNCLEHLKLARWQLSWHCITMPTEMVEKLADWGNDAMCKTRHTSQAPDTSAILDHPLQCWHEGLPVRLVNHCAWPSGLRNHCKK